MYNYLKKLKERVLKRKKIDKNKQNLIFIFWDDVYRCWRLDRENQKISLYLCIRILCSLFVYENRAVFFSGEIKKPTKIN